MAANPSEIYPEEQEVALDPTQAVITPDDEGGSMTELPSGDIEFNFEGDDSLLERPQQEGGFDENLAEQMTKTERSALSQTLIEYKRIDLQSRENWEKLKGKYLALVGATEIDAKRLPFPGAAQVYHPVLAEAMVQFQSNAIEEFFPAGGPVKGDLAGDATDENRAQVDRAEKFMNFYLTQIDKGYYADCDQELFILSADGSTFKKTFVDPVDGMPKSRFVRVDDFIVPYYCVDLQTSPRYCHRYKMSGEEITLAIQNGQWSAIPLMDPGSGEDHTEIDTKDVSDRRRKVLHDDDKLYTILEYHVMRELPPNVDELVELDDDGMPVFLPSYVVTCVEELQEIVCAKRLWAEDDPHHEKEVWFSHKKFLNGFGFYGFGFPHVIGSLAEAATGAERALLDSALMATMQGGFRAKDGIKGGEGLKIEPGVYKDVDGTFEELSKTFFNPPFKEPAPALFQMLGAIVNDARRFASITEVLVGQADNKAPVGTTLALIEQSMKLFTAIHKRIFNAAQQEFQQLAKLFHRHAPFDQYPYYLKGEQQMMLREDFDDRVDFIPVADPNIISSVQRISIAQATLELANNNPDLYSPDQLCIIHEEFLKALKVPYADKIAPKAPKPTFVDAVTENAMLLLGKGVRAFPGQYHDGHIMLHQQQLLSAQASLPADQFEQIYMNTMSHIREHMALSTIEQVSKQMEAQTGAPMPPIDIFANEEDMDPQLEMALTMVAARMMPQVALPPAPGVDAQGEEGGEQADPVAEAESKAQALEVETTSRIERDTTEFVAAEKRKKEEHGAKMVREDEEHRQKMRLQDNEAAAKIIRDNAAAISKQRATAAESAQRIAHEGRSSQMKSKLETASAQNKIQLAKDAAAAKPKKSVPGRPK